MSEPADRDVTRRTRLAAERTGSPGGAPGSPRRRRPWRSAAWCPGSWRAGTPYVVLGAGYALLAAVVFAGAALRRRLVDRALDRGDYERLGETGVVALTVAAMTLALGTLVVIIAQA
jgi:drug/metabolite transporter (DMT)-like permease